MLEKGSACKDSDCRAEGFAELKQRGFAELRGGLQFEGERV